MISRQRVVLPQAPLLRQADDGACDSSVFGIGVKKGQHQHCRAVFGHHIRSPSSPLAGEQAWLTVSVVAVSDAPETTSFRVTTREDTPVLIALQATDVDTDAAAVSRLIISLPTKGRLFSTNSVEITTTPTVVQSVMFFPELDQVGDPLDAYAYSSFQYAAFDGALTSPGVATVVVAVTPVNDAPVAVEQTLLLQEDVPLLITLQALDPDATDILTAKVLSLPKIGTLFQVSESGSGLGNPIRNRGVQVVDSQHRLWYVPDADVVGQDVFTFQVSDGTFDTAETAVRMSIASRPDAPTAPSLSLTISDEGTLPIPLNITDPDGDDITVTIPSLPVRGTLFALQGGERRLVRAGVSFVVSALLYITGLEGSGNPYSNFSYTALDTSGLTASGNVVITARCRLGLVNNFWSTVGPVCIECPTGSVCSSEGRFVPVANPGFYRVKTDTGIAYLPCPHPEACRGGAEPSEALTGAEGSVVGANSCLEGYKGRLCGLCGDDFYRSGRKCLSCEGYKSRFWLVVFLAVPCVLGVALTLVWLSHKGVSHHLFASPLLTSPFLTSSLLTFSSHLSSFI